MVGSEQQTVFTTHLESPVGPILAAATSEGICLLEFTNSDLLETQLSTLQTLFKQPTIQADHEHLVHLKEELAAYFAGNLQQFSLPLVYPGTPFQKSVWSTLLEIPYGKTWSYEALAEYIGSSKAQRAVGRANGMNRISIVIPCHRVINKGGKLGGYGGGLWRKKWLLALEQGQNPTPIENPNEQGQLKLF